MYTKAQIVAYEHRTGTRQLDMRRQYNRHRTTLSGGERKRVPVQPGDFPPLPKLKKAAPADGGWIGEYWEVHNAAQKAAFEADAWCALCNKQNSDPWGNTTRMVYCDNGEDHAFHLTCYGYWNRQIRKRNYKRLFETFPLLRQNVLYDQDGAVKASHQAAADSRRYEWKPGRKPPALPTEYDLWCCSMPRCQEAEKARRSALETAMRAEHLDPTDARDRRKFFRRQRQ